ncbi:hypothetical protein EDD15DRAFT_2390119 [Pisolithus albus]|nr:hypothetical protein EDD15DRAFT_2390119 [Pisolithus albus]
MPQTIPRSPAGRRAVSASRIPCLHAGCHRWFKTASGLNHHKLSFHSYSFHKSGLPSHLQSTSPHEGIVHDYHEELTGQKCDSNGQPIHPSSLPPPIFKKPPDDWGSYGSQLGFETAEFIFQEAEMSASKIDKLLYLWGCSNGGRPPFSDHNELYETIDATKLGDIRWDTFKLRYNGERPTDNVPPWMDEEYEYWYHDPSTVVENMLSNMEFDGEIDYAPYWDFTAGDKKRRYENFMSGDWAWLQADEIARDPSTHGATFVPIILGSDKTTVSVATGQNDYWLVYLSIGNIHNNVRRAHRNGVKLLSFLAIPKAAKKYTDDPTILSSLKAGMTVPQVMKCPDGHFRRAIFGIGPYIADYLEQVLISGIVQNWCGRCIALPDNLDAGGPPRTAELTRALIEELQAGAAWDEWGIDVNVVPFTEDFPHADICQLLAPDILHQLVKGSFKDHLVEWVGKYLELEYGKVGAKERMMDIDRRIAAALPFPGLRRFPDGWGFSQWTGDDSKALMKGHVPQDIVRTLRAFLEFCYIIRQNVITDDTLKDLRNALERFHHYHEVFRDVGVQTEGFSLPRQHSLVHYEALICLFGAPNGLCTSITESKHITAVKKPWQRSSNGASQHFDDVEDEDEHAGIIDERPALAHSDVKLARCHARGRARSVPALAIELGIPVLSMLIAQFLYEQLSCESTPLPAGACHLPVFTGPLKVFHSATATFVSPSDLSRIGGMRRETIRAIPVWHQGPAWYDTIFVSTDDTFNRMLSMEIARMLCFFSFIYTNGRTYSCALIHWFDHIADEPDKLTGMWMVRPSFMGNGSKNLSIIHLDSIVRSAHLLPIFGHEQVPRAVNFHNSLDIYCGFYVNRFADYHAFELAS